MSRQQQRKVHKLTITEIQYVEDKAMTQGIQATLMLVYEVMAEEFGFGKKRLDKLENAMLVKMGVEG